MGRFFMTNSTFLIDIGVFRLSISSGWRFGSWCTMRLCENLDRGRMSEWKNGGTSSWLWRDWLCTNLDKSAESFWTCQVALVVKNPPASAGDIKRCGFVPWVGRSSGVGNGHPVQYFAWKIPWTEEPGGLQCKGSQRVRHNWRNLKAESF